MLRLSPSESLLRAVVAVTLVAACLSSSVVTGQPRRPASAQASPPCAAQARGQGGAAVRPYTRTPSREALRWADAQLRRMTLDEKIGQLVSIGVNATYLSQESEEYKSLRRQIEVNKVGGIILFRGPVYESVHLVNRMQQIARHPLLVSADLESGAGMRFEHTINFPWNMAVGATHDPELARRQGEVTAREARALGVHQIFAPVVDVNNNAQNPVINVRSYGEDPQLVAEMAAAFVRGAQCGGVVATAKHFPGHGDTSVDSHRGLPVIDLPRARLDSVELVPFRAAIDAGVGAVMSAHIGLPQIDATKVQPLPRTPDQRPSYADSEVLVEGATLPGTLSPQVLTGILRRQLGFDGMIVTDALDMSGLTIYFTPGESAVRSLLAGADMLLKPSDPDATVSGVREAVRSGRLTEKRIEESARRVLAAKYDLGLVRRRIAPIEEIDRVVSNADAQRLAQEIADRAVTLVRDEARLLPLNSLKPDARVFVLAVTNGEDRLFIAQPFAATLARSGRKFQMAVLDERSSEKEVERALDAAKESDLVVAALYGRVRTGQANSGALPGPGQRALEKLIERKRPLVGISFGNPYLLQSFPELKTYVVAYGDMPSLQRAAARALLGQVDVTGRLPISLPKLHERGTGIQLKAQTAAVPADAPQSGGGARSQAGDARGFEIFVARGAYFIDQKRYQEYEPRLKIVIPKADPTVGEILEEVKKELSKGDAHQHTSALHLMQPFAAEGLENSKTVSEYGIRSKSVLWVMSSVR